MKKILLISIFLLIVLAKLLAQPNIGFVAGGMDAFHIDAIEYFRKSNDIGINVGFCLEQKISKHASLELDVQFTYIKNTIETDSIYRVINPYLHNLGAGGSVHADYENHGIRLPLYLKYHINIFNPFVGVQFEIYKNNINNRDYGIYHDYYNFDGQLDQYGDAIYLRPGTFDYGWLAGVECNITSQIGLRLSYYRGMNEALVYEITKGIYNGQGGTLSTHSTRKASLSLNLLYRPDWSKLKNMKQKSTTSGKKPISGFLKELY